MSKIRGFFRKAVTPVTIMLIPHSNAKSFNLKISFIWIVLSVILWM